MKIYLAGPLFTAAERRFNLDLATKLVALGHTPWVPQGREPRDASAKSIFEKDVEGIDWADLVLANMDGSDPDSGTCWECGYAYKKKPVIVFRTDFRAGEVLCPCNLMLWESATERVLIPIDASLNELVVAINFAIRKLVKIPMTTMVK